MDVRAETKRILAEQALLDPSDLSDEQSLQDVGLDSLGLVETIFAIEERFDVHVPFNANAPEESAFDVSSIGAICAAVEQLVREQKGAA